MDLKLLEKLVKENHGILCNANDTFEYSTAESVVIPYEDLEWVLPIYEKYPFSGLEACMAYIIKRMPIPPLMTEEFKKAYAELEELNPEVESDWH